MPQFAATTNLDLSRRTTVPSWLRGRSGRQMGPDVKPVQGENDQGADP